MLRSSLFIQNEFRIRSVLPVCGDQNEIHTGKNAEASVSAELRLQLIAQIGHLVIQKFHFRSARKAVREIHKPSDKGVQFFHFGHLLQLLNCSLA